MMSIERGPKPAFNIAARSRPPLEIGGQGGLVAVPVFYGSVFGFEEAEKTAIGAIFETVAPNFDGIPWFDVVTRDADIF